MEKREAATNSPVENGESFTAIAYQVLKRAIIRCELEPGSQVTEPQLVRRYGLKSTAVHTALNRLAQEDLIQPVRRQGYRVAAITLESTHDLFDLRMIVEPVAARRAATSITEEQLQRLRALGNRRFNLTDLSSVDEFLAVNAEIHGLIAEAANNRQLARLIGSLVEQMHRVIHLGIQLRENKADFFHEHEDLIEALAQRDGERAHQVMLDQLNVSRSSITAMLVQGSRIRSINLAGS